MTEEEKYKQPIGSGLWPETRQAIRFLLWTIVFYLVGTALISTAGVHLR